MRENIIIVKSLRVIMNSTKNHKKQKKYGGLASGLGCGLGYGLGALAGGAAIALASALAMEAAPNAAMNTQNVKTQIAETQSAETQSAKTQSAEKKCVRVTLTPAKQDSTQTTETAKQQRQIIIAETATSLAEKQRGLMHRDILPQGMLFLYRNPQILSMWMKNTPKSLDIVFISPEKRIVNIVRGTTPFSLQALYSKGLAVAALELPAGKAQSMKTGDAINWTHYTVPCP